MMKILFITPKIPYPPLDGHRKSMWGVIKYLSLLGHQIDLVCYSQNENIAAVKNEIEKHARLFALEVNTKNTMSGAIRNLFSPVPYNLWKFDRPELKIFLKEYFKTENPEVVHVVNTHMGFIVDFIREYSSAPVVLRLENLEMMIMKRYYENQKNYILKMFSFAQYKKYLVYESELCAKFDKRIMMSEEDEKQWRLLNPNVKTTVNPPGIEKGLLILTKDEIYSIVQIEVMTCGKPVICTELGTGTTFINQNEITRLVIPPRNSKLMEAAINKLIKNTELREKLSNQGRERVFKEFTSDKKVAKTYELYQNILGK